MKATKSRIMMPLIMLCVLTLSVLGQDKNQKQLERCTQGLKEVKDRALASRGLHVACLVQIGEPAVATLLVTLKDANQFARWGAAEALTNIAASRPRQGVGFSANLVPEVINALSEALLKDEYHQVRYTAAGALSNIANLDSGSTEPVVAILIRSLGDEDSEVRWTIANSLAELALRVPNAILTAFLERRKDPDERVRGRIVYGFAKLASVAPQPSISALIGMLKDNSGYVRERAARGLGGIGSLAREAIPSLQEAQSDSEKSVRKAAQWALKQIEKK